MPRDGGGTYTLPAGNPVIPGTIIETTWANPTMDDIAAALTDSLSRTGSGGMISPFLNADGSVALPGISWANQQNMGIWRPGLDEMRVSVAGVDKSRWTSSGSDPFEMFISSMWVPVMHEAGDYSPTGNWDFSGAASFIYAPFPNPFIITGADVLFTLRETGSTADEGVWNWRANGDQLVLASATDGAPLTDVENAIAITRVGTAIGPWTLRGGQWDFLDVAGADTLRILMDGTSAIIRMLTSGEPLILDAVNEGVSLFHDGLCRWETQTAGMVALRSDGNTDTEDRLIVFDWQDATCRARLGYIGDDILILRNEIHGGNVKIQAEDTGGVLRQILEGDPDGLTTVRGTGDLRLQVAAGEIAFYGTANGKSAMYHNNNERARTLTAANGGLEVDNQDTGLGFERVLTTSDLGGGGGAGNFNGCLAYRPTTQLIPNAVWTSVNFPNETYDTTGTIHNNVSNTNRLTVPTGVTRIRLKGGLQFSANVTGTRLLRIRKDGANLSVDDGRSAFRPFVTFSPHIQSLWNQGTIIMTGIIEVVAGDWFELQCYQGSLISLLTVASAPWFEMEIIQ